MATWPPLCSHSHSHGWPLETGLSTIARVPQIIKPFLRGRDVKRWRVDSQDLWLIFTRRGVDIDAYPACKAHLQAFRKQLEPKPADWNGKVQGAWPGRKPGIYEWFHIQDNIAYWQEFEQPKIVFPDIALSPQFAWDSRNHYLANTAYIIPRIEKWLLAVLNSSVSAWFYSQISPQIMNGYYRFIAQYVEQIPIPPASTQQKRCIEEVVDCVVNRISAPEYERLLNGLVYELFFPEDLHAKGIHLFDACAEAGITDWPAPDETAGKKKPATVAQLGWNLRASSTADEIFQPNHPIYGMLFELQSVEVVRLIEGIA